MIYAVNWSDWLNGEVLPGFVRFVKSPPQKKRQTNRSHIIDNWTSIPHRQKKKDNRKLRVTKRFGLPKEVHLIQCENTS